MCVYSVHCVCHCKPSQLLVTLLSDEIDRIVDRLERLHRTRKGQPLPSQVDVKIS
jgi:hypothetical protein